MPNVTTGPVTNDLGLDAWEIRSLSTASQYLYVSGAFTPAEKAAVTSEGFSFSFTARVLQGPFTSIYSAATPYVIGAVGVDTGTRRYQVFLGLDAAGDTVVVLPSSINNGGAGSRIQAPGSAFTLTGQGNDYHDYRLDFSRTTQLASLLIDGNLSLSNYGGYDNFLGDYGFALMGFSGATARFSSAQLSLVPEPTSFAFMLLGLSVLAGLRRRSS